MGAGVGSHVVNLLPVADGDDLVERRVALDEARETLREGWVGAARLQRRLELPVLVPQLLLQRAHVLLVAEVGAQLLEGGGDFEQARCTGVRVSHFCSCRGERAPAVLDELGQRVLAGGGSGGAGQRLPKPLEQSPPLCR